MTDEFDCLPDMTSFRFPSNNTDVMETFEIDKYELHPDIMEVDASTEEDEENDFFASKFPINTNRSFRSDDNHLSISSNISNQESLSPPSFTSSVSPGNTRNSGDSTMSSVSSRFSCEIPTSKVKELDPGFQFEGSYQPKGKRSSIHTTISPFGTRYDFEKPRTSLKKDKSSSFLHAERISKSNDENNENTLELYKTSLPIPPVPRRVSITTFKKYRHSRNLSISSSPVSPQEQSSAGAKLSSTHNSISDSRSRPNKQLSVDNEDLKRVLINEYTYQDRLVPRSSHDDIKNWPNPHADITDKDTAMSISYEDFDDKNTCLLKSSSSSVYSVGEGEMMTMKHHRPSIVYITTDPTTQTLDLGRIDQC